MLSELTWFLDLRPWAVLYPSCWGNEQREGRLFSGLSSCPEPEVLFSLVCNVTLGRTPTSPRKPHPPRIPSGREAHKTEMNGMYLKTDV